MTELSVRPEAAPDRFPLSSAQEMWCAGDAAGSFGPRFIMAEALRLRGRIDVAALQAALDDLVVRHEILRTAIVRDVTPPYQSVHPPCPVPLVVRDRPAAPADRDRIAAELANEAELSTVDVDELPLLRAGLTRFDDEDAVLTLVTHHAAGDGWSFQLLIRDLAALYLARSTGQPPALPVPRQYRDYAAWERERRSGSDAEVLAYWREKLRGAEVFALPTDRPVQKVPQSPYEACNYRFGLDLMEPAAALATATRSSVFIVLLAAFDVLANRITGTTDPVIHALTAGRNQPEFRDTVGPFLGFLALRTDLGACGSFRDVVVAARKSLLEAYANEVPFHRLARQLPEIMRPLDDPRMCELIFGFFRPPSLGGQVTIGDDTQPVRQLKQRSTQIPGGVGWNMGAGPSGEVFGKVQFNPDEFDERTMRAWTEEYGRILALATAEPDRDWRDL
ncbi:MAG: condensation domain-containing protein [Frankiaceae bacterium]